MERNENGAYLLNPNEIVRERTREMDRCRTADW